jgi:AcrR family transcriptional regulator
MAAARRGPKAPPEEHELRLLYDAAVQVIARDGIEAVTLSSLLQEAGLGTRAFYRHFESKDQFLVATWLRQTQAASEALESKMDGARRPIAAVEVWVDDFLDRLYSRDGTPHVEALWRNGFWLRNAYPNEFGSIVRVQLNALFRCLVDGSAKGEFPETDPQLDASTILATCWMLAELGLRGDPIPRDAARRHLLRVVRGLTGFVDRR